MSLGRGGIVNSESEESGVVSCTYMSNFSNFALGAYQNTAINVYGSFLW